MEGVQKWFTDLNNSSEVDQGFYFATGKLGVLGVKHNCSNSGDWFCAESMDDKEIDYSCSKCYNGENECIFTITLARLAVLHAEYQQTYLAAMMENIDKRLKEIEKSVFISKEERALELALAANIDVNNLKPPTEDKPTIINATVEKPKKKKAKKTHDVRSE
jgi:hypothetical protein